MAEASSEDAMLLRLRWPVFGVLRFLNALLRVKVGPQLVVERAKIP